MLPTLPIVGARYAKQMLSLILQEDYKVLFDDADQMLIAGFPWRVLKHQSGLFYAHAWNGRMHLYMHRLIAGAGPDETVDHWNGWGLDNQKHNLRIASRGQQQANRGRQRNNRYSQYKGVTWDKNRNKWAAWATVDGRRANLGRFADETEAAKAYDAAALEAWGVFARLNFPVDNGVVCGQHQLDIPGAPCVCS
jgi:hypothetical protein